MDGNRIELRIDDPILADDFAHTRMCFSVRVNRRQEIGLNLSPPDYFFIQFHKYLHACDMPAECRYIQS